jgi:hypothetical protein
VVKSSNEIRYVPSVLPLASPIFNSGSVTLLLSYRRSMTCGYENYVLSGRRDIDWCVTGVIEIVLCVYFVQYNSTSKKDLA